MDHRVEPPSWLPQGAAPKAADPAEADEAPASDDAHALQDDSAEADSTAEEFSNGNGHEGPYTYLRDDSQIYNQDSPYADGQDGAYAGRAVTDGKEFVAALSVGYRPTFGGTQLRVEAFLLDFEGDLYGQTLEVEFIRPLRPEQRFPNLEALRSQIAADIAAVRALAG